MKKILTGACALITLLFAGCTREGVPSGEMTSAQLHQNPASAEYMTLGNYAMFKDPEAYIGEDANYPEQKDTYIRFFFLMSEFRGDNVALCYQTTDDVTTALMYNDTPSLRMNSYMWWIAYHIIYGSNSVIESLADGVSEDLDHIKGENYFLRALCHLNLVSLYAEPYSHGTENPGVILRTSTDTSVTTRATVGEVYDQIVADLQEAIRLMDNSSSRDTNHSFASKAAAQGLLSRVYLYMERNDDVISTVNDMLGGATPADKLDPNIGTYYANTLTSNETLWAVGQTPTDLGSTASAKIAAMYYTDDAGTGWGQALWSDPLLDLFNRYPMDKRLQLCVTRLPDGAAAGAMQIRYPQMSGAGDQQVGLPAVKNATWDAAAGKYYFTDADDNNVYLETEQVNGYDTHYIMLDGVKTQARIAPAATLTSYNFFPQFFMTKFSNQDGIGMISSPAMIRWGEVILNRAEAYAKTGQDDLALADVNAIRTRAGLPEDAMFTMDNYQSRGYSSVLDVVLDERRMELCFEGQRAIDLIRNNKPVDRQYCGAHYWGTIQPDDPRFPYRIPADEINVSGIPQNQ